MSYWGYYREYETVGQKIAKAKRQLEKLRKTNPDICPVIIMGNTIAKSWWGKAWTKNLESYADYSNRIGRGRSYVRNGLVIDLKIDAGQVTALVCGSSNNPYKIKIVIQPLLKEKIDYLAKLCNNRINGLEELVAGRFPKELEDLFTQKNQGLFPSNREITFNCSCPDSAYMCKHVSAVLYAIGAKFDSDPTLFFKLRGIEFELFLAKTVEEKMRCMLKNAGKNSKRVITDKEAANIFGIL
ncbi:MAG: SWIM zinc finger family protein [Nitrososphaerota archaeon]|jgi:uncharacterized Zn finger protein|uniref:SWIM zinc finger family protein n=1 Tax=Candidatus Bathycorpusculum sp. TaxID=2994959 RepID=UPI0028259A9D|nr:SWIM zinc finger family protein [Candidatus Termiticorpusculum sp.]MCL2257481.1 SWIM zinc finger family protein [Candidatus Termiticorpusculum sp.]MCL2292393.1 SWIM zinc finger family protein [Candidatus Termiticorpusculum sp.]MDR0460612.1 SWIM zinc finger family protein [Nitrososphaerota archaeon]